MTKDDIERVKQIVITCFFTGEGLTEQSMSTFSRLMQEFTPEVIPDMFWNVEDTDVQYVSIGALLLDALSEGWLEENSEVKIIQAKKCNPVKIKVTSISDNDIDWEVIA